MDILLIIYIYSEKTIKDLFHWNRVDNTKNKLVQYLYTFCTLDNNKK